MMMMAGQHVPHQLALIADTHGYLDPLLASYLSTHSFSHVLHAGDLGDKRPSRLKPRAVLERLQELCPKAEVSAVCGNVDEPFIEAGEVNQRELPRERVLGISGLRILLVHGHTLALKFPCRSAKPESTTYVKGLEVEVCISGHTHVPGKEEFEGVLYLNPGSAGPRRFKLPRTFMHVCIDPGQTIERINVELIDLDNIACSSVTSLPAQKRKRQ